MPGTSDTFTSSNRLTKQPTGGNYNLWGVYLNDNMDLIDDMKDGNLILSLGTAQHTLTTNTGAADQARMASITVTGSAGTATGGTATITAPNVEKLTFVENILSGTSPIVWTNGTGTNITIPNDAVAMVQCDAAGNMKHLAPTVFGGKRLTNVGLGTATDDVARVDQINTIARGFPLFGTIGQVVQNLGPIGTDTATTSYGWATPRYVSTGGSAGQVLRKTGTATDSYAWEDQGMATMFFPAKSFTEITTNGGTQTSIMCATSSRMVDAIVFGSATSQYASVTIGRMPRSWDRKNLLVSVEAFTTGTSGTQVFEVNVGFANIVAGAAIDAPFNYSSAMLGTEAGTASFDIITGTATGSVVGGTASSGAGLGLMLRRNIVSGNDTLAGNLFVTGLNLRYNNNLPNDN